MVREIVTDVLLLGRKSTEAGAEDKQTACDLLDTLLANRERCVGMAANMIGVTRRIIVFFDGMTPRVMYNPVITAKQKPYETEEGCLSLSGQRKTKRWGEITVEYLDESMIKRRRKYAGWTAQIIQHEVDHCDGIII